MAISNLQLNVRANTARALADFNKFSRSLDNKFLMSGLKLDVITSALDRINRDFQRAIGEQGLASASSLRAAQNQAALLTQTFKGFASDSAIAIQEQIGTALNRVAVTAGGTMKDVQKTLAATPFISTRLSEDMRDQLNKGILAFQRDARRAGLGENFGGIAQQFLMGRASGMDLVETGNPLESFIGAEIIKRSGGQGEITDPLMRSQILSEILGDKEIQDMLRRMSRQAMGYRIVLEDMNTHLFNPEMGVFGSLRKVVDAAGNTTTMFDEVEKLTKQVFGPGGMFAALSSTINEIFGIKDPMRPFIDAVQMVTRVFKALTDYFKSSGFAEIVTMVRETFGRVGEVFKEIYDQIRGGTFNADNISKIIVEIGTAIRSYIKNISQNIRERDDEKVIGFVSDIAGTLFEEVGKTTVVLIRELFATLVDKAPEIASSVLPAINRGINNILDEAFGPLSKVIKPVLATMPGPVGMVARSSMITDATGGQGGLGLLGAAAPFLLAGSGGLLGAGRSLLTGTGRGPTALRALGLGMTGLDPMTSLMLGFAPQMLSGVPGVLGGMNAARTGFMNSRLAATLSGYAGAINPMAQGVMRGLGSARTGFMNSRVAATLSGYAGAVSPLAQRLGGSAVNQLSRAYNLYNTAYVGARGVGNQFLSGLRPGAFPTFRTRTTAPYQAGQFIRNIPGNILSSIDPAVTAVSSLGPKLSNAASGVSSRLATAAASTKGAMISLGSTIYRSSVSLAGNLATSARLFAAGTNLPGGYRIPGAVPMATRAGQAFARFSPVGLAGGVVALGSQLLGSSVGGRTGQKISGVGAVLGGGMAGASTGAMIGSVIAPGIGTAAGAVIGGIIGGIAPLMDKGVREGFSKFLSDIGDGLKSTLEWFLEGTKENFAKLGDMLRDGFKFFVNGLINILNGVLSAFQILPKLIMGVVRGAYEKVPGLDLIPGVKQAVEAGNAVANFQIPPITMFNGKDYYGPSMALEAQMSGRRPMVVNDGEFVIPKDGFPTLAGLVANNLRSTNALREPPNNTQVNITLAITTNSVVADASELANTLREPVYQIINDAWAEATASNVQRSRVN